MSRRDLSSVRGSSALRHLSARRLFALVIRPH